MSRLLMMIFFLLGVLFLKCQSQNNKENNEDIEFINLQSHYNKTFKFSYRLINNTQKVYEYYVGLEAYFNNSWNEVLIDVDISAPDKAAIVKTLLPQEDKKTSFHLLNYFPLKTDTNSPENNILKITSYRFVLNYRLKSESDFKQKPSKSFLVD